MDYILNFLFNFSIFFEILTLSLAFYFKKTRIFFISFSLIFFKIIYLYSSLYQTNLFISIFMPFLFFIFILMKNTDLIFDKKNINKLAIIFLITFLSFILTNNTNFNNDILNYDLKFINTPINDFSFILFIFELVFISVLSFIRKEIYMIFAFIGVYIQFLININYFYIEFSSLVLTIYIIYSTYKNTYYDKNTNLKNKKALIRYTKGLLNYQLALIHLEELNFTQEKYKNIILKIISKKLKKIKIQIFSINNDFVLLFKDMDKNQILDILAFVESLLKNIEFNIENEKFKPLIKIIFDFNDYTNYEEKLKVITP